MTRFDHGFFFIITIVMIIITTITQLEDNEDPTVVYPVRFDLDLFYVAPFYHSFFPDIDKMVVVDLDLEFRLIHVQ